MDGTTTQAVVVMIRSAMVSCVIQSSISEMICTPPSWAASTGQRRTARKLIYASAWARLLLYPRPIPCPPWRNMSSSSICRALIWMTRPPCDSTALPIASSTCCCRPSTNSLMILVFMFCFECFKAYYWHSSGVDHM